MSKKTNTRTTDSPTEAEVTANGKLTRLEFAETIGLKPGRLTNLRDAKRMCSRLIRGFIKGEVSGSDAKTLSYLLSTYVTIAQGSDIEARLDELENKIDGDRE